MHPSIVLATVLLAVASAQWGVGSPYGYGGWGSYYGSNNGYYGKRWLLIYSEMLFPGSGYYGQAYDYGYPQQ